MPFELYSNNVQTTLNMAGNLSSGATSMVVSNASGFPASGNFRILVESELILVTSVSGTMWTITRGIEGSTVASHLNGVIVTHILTAASLILAGTLSGAFASRPAAGISGRKYYCTDCPFWYLDNGSTWLKYFGAYPIVTPDDSTFTWDNQASSVITTTTDMVNLLPGTGTSFRYKAAPSTPYKIDAMILLNWSVISTNPTFALGFRESSSGKLAVLLLSLNSTAGTFSLNSSKFNSSSSFDANYASNNGGLPMAPLFLRVADDGTNRILSTSLDGINFAVYHSIGRTDFLTADEVCWGGYNNNDGVSSGSLIHWLAH